MILSYADKDTERFAAGERVRRFEAFAGQAVRRMAQLEQAERLADMAVPPGNRLERLRGDRQGQHSVRLNRQWRLCFVWDEDGGGARNVEIVDYH